MINYSESYVMEHLPSAPKKLSVSVFAALAVLGGMLGNQAGAAESAQVSAAVRNEIREQVKRELMAEMKAQIADEIRRQVQAELAAAGVSAPSAQSGTAANAGEAAAPGDKAKGRVVRVPYISESTKREIREQLKSEVLAQSKEERWGNPGALPEWLDRISFEGDIRLRMDSFHLAKDNTPAGAANNVSGTGMTRGADLVGANGNIAGVPNVNTQEDFTRTRLRFRFGAQAKISDTVSAGFRIATGNTSGPTSTNQTMGQGFNKYSLVLDRGYVTLQPTSWLSLTGGRIANPFFSTDLVWADDLSFEGLAAHLSHALTPRLTAFATIGWFPLRTDNPLQSTSRDLTGIQAGVKWQLAPKTDLKLAAAIYDYHGMEGALEDNGRYGPPSASDYGTRYEYPNGLRQRGNTLFIANALADTNYQSTTYWGLASGFQELNLTGSLDIANFDPVHVVLTGDYVKNLAFDRNKMSLRTGSSVQDGKDSGFLGKVSIGHVNMTKLGDWNVSMAYRWLGSDAVLDAFTNSDFGMGGTNNKGYILGGSYGIAKNTWLSARWLSSQLIDSMAPKTTSTATSTKLSVDLLQVELNSRF